MKMSFVLHETVRISIVHMCLAWIVSSCGKKEWWLLLSLPVLYSHGAREGDLHLTREDHVYGRFQSHQHIGNHSPSSSDFRIKHPCRGMYRAAV